MPRRSRDRGPASAVPDSAQRSPVCGCCGTRAERQAQFDRVRAEACGSGGNRAYGRVSVSGLAILMIMVASAGDLPDGGTETVWDASRAGFALRSATANDT
jgi:hypothetical protein